ncbi:MurR/RpiR family transcriptional regulator [Corticicoccus populi]|uniref:MurR/RpiR family transcriptional regulator n=1 Tax=Corticicoccus populi TaxID=1812821 RepID=A0ABW5X0T0_9STAP
MNFNQRVLQKHDYLSDSEKFLVDFIEKNIRSINSLSIVKLSEQSNVSTSTIVRCMKKLGYKGFTDFKFKITLENSDAGKDDILNFKNIDKQIETAILKNKEEVENTLSFISPVIIEDALEAINYSRKITIFARGFSEMIAEEMTTKLQLLDKHCEMHSDPNIIRLKSNYFGKDDLVIFISLSGNTGELVESAEICHRHNIKTILLTTNKNGHLYSLTDIILLGYKSEQSYFPEYEVRSRLPLQVLSRILLDSYVIRYKKNQHI